MSFREFKGVPFWVMLLRSCMGYVKLNKIEELCSKNGVCDYIWKGRWHDGEKVRFWNYEEW